MKKLQIQYIIDAVTSHCGVYRSYIFVNLILKSICDIEKEITCKYMGRMICFLGNLYI